MRVPVWRWGLLSMSSPSPRGQAFLRGLSSPLFPLVGVKVAHPTAPPPSLPQWQGPRVHSVSVFLPFSPHWCGVFCLLTGSSDPAQGSGGSPTLHLTAMCLWGLAVALPLSQTPLVQFHPSACWELVSPVKRLLTFGGGCLGEESSFLPVTVTDGMGLSYHLWDYDLRQESRPGGMSFG